MHVRCEAANEKCKEQTVASLPAPPGGQPIYLRMQVNADSQAVFSFSTNGTDVTTVGAPFTATMGRWVGAQVGIFATGAAGAHADIDYLHITP